MIELLLTGLRSDIFCYEDEIKLIKNFKPEIVTCEYSTDYEKTINNEEEVKELPPYGLFERILKFAPIKPIGPTDEDYDNKNVSLTTDIGIANYLFNEDGITFMEYHEGLEINKLINKGYSRIAIIVGGSHLPLTEVPVETPLIKTIMESTNKELHFKLINYLKQEDVEFLRRIDIERKIKARNKDLENALRMIKARTINEKLKYYQSIKGLYLDLVNRLRILKRFSQDS